MLLLMGQFKSVTVGFLLSNQLRVFREGTGYRGGNIAFRFKLECLYVLDLAET